MLVYSRESSSFSCSDLIGVIVPSEFLREFDLCLEGVLFIFLMDSVDSFDCLLVLGADADLFVLGYFFALLFLLIELLELFPELVRLLFFGVPMPFFLLLVAFVGVGKMLIIVFSFLVLLFGDFLLVLVDF